MSQGKEFIVTESARLLIQIKAGQLCRRGFCPSEREDIEQELWLAVLRQAERFDPLRASLETFLDRVVGRGVILLWRSRNRRKRGSGVTPCSLESQFLVTAEGRKPLGEVISSEDGARRMRTHVPDAMARSEETEAVEHALAQMPEWLREICRRLTTGTVASVARELGVSRHRIRRALAEARPYFEEAGLENS
jgi:RNA polymerase sigma factor (sigma-70 family)